jgi:hypothetical protein
MRIKELELSKQEINKLSVDLIRGHNQNDRDKCIELAWTFFIDYHNSMTSYHSIYPNSKQNNNNNTTKCYGVWKRSDHVDIEEHIKNKLWRAKFKLNLNPLFFYAEEKNVIFSDEEKSILNLIFLPTPVREFLYKNYSDINFIEAIIKYYVSFTFHYLKNPTKKKSHYFDKEFLNYLINKNKDEIEHKFIVKRTNKEIKMLDKNHDKMKEYLTTPSKNKKNYVVYESLHYFYKNIMDELDDKMLRLLLNEVPKKIK